MIYDFIWNDISFSRESYIIFFLGSVGELTRMGTKTYIPRIANFLSRSGNRPETVGDTRIHAPIVLTSLYATRMASAGDHPSFCSPSVSEVGVLNTGKSAYGSAADAFGSDCT